MEAQGLARAGSVGSEWVMGVSHRAGEQHGFWGL